MDAAVSIRCDCTLIQGSLEARYEQANTKRRGLEFHVLLAGSNASKVELSLVERKEIRGRPSLPGYECQHLCS